VARRPPKCQWTGFREALKAFVVCASGHHQSSEHIRPLHWHVACRLVIEGGFHPDDVTPRPPFLVRPRQRMQILEYAPESAGSGERTLLGGLKTKAVDVVVTKRGVGPVLAVSLKGTLNAFRNLTNRMEEAVGDCTNLHIAYPALVYGFFQVMRANREGPNVAPNDMALSGDGQVTESIRRYHDVLARLADRADVRAETTKYEAVALTLVEPDPSADGEQITSFPPPESPLLLADFFEKLYAQYDQRFVYTAPALATTTRRLEWAPDSPALRDPRMKDFTARAGDPE